MKTQCYPLWFLYSSRGGKAGALSASASGDNACFSERIAMVSPRLIYESTAKDVFWILYPHLREKKHPVRASCDCGRQ